MSKQYSVIIGKMNPPHRGHEKLIETALNVSDKVIILLGSANQPRTIKNPFTVYERQTMIEAMFPAQKHCFIFDYIEDVPYNDQKWLMSVQNAVDNQIENDFEDPDQVEIKLVGNNKDESSYYLKMFPQWENVTCPFLEGFKDVMSSTDVRSILFTELMNVTIKKLEPFLTSPVIGFIKEFMTTDEYLKLVEEYGFIQKYKKSWANAPYSPIFVTTDCCLVQSGHVLLIKRKSAPGRGLWALPGGFLDQNERIEDAMIRELREETKIKVPEPVLRGSIKAIKVFDHPQRSLRGRTITHAFLIVLPDGELPRVRGADDAEKAKWVPLNEVKTNNMFEDHKSIIDELISRI